jgi:transposase
MKYHQHTGDLMTVDNINVEETVKRVTELIAAEKDLSPPFKASLEVLLLLISILVNRLGLQ